MRTGKEKEPPQRFFLLMYTGSAQKSFVEFLCNRPAQCLRQSSRCCRVNCVSDCGNPAHQNLRSRSSDRRRRQRAYSGFCRRLADRFSEHLPQGNRHRKLDRRYHKIITARYLRQSRANAPRRGTRGMNNCMAFFLLFICHLSPLNSLRAQSPASCCQPLPRRFSYKL